MTRFTMPIRRPAFIAPIEAHEVPAYSEKERQRVAHLVLQIKRPTLKVTVGRRGGRHKPKLVDQPAPLVPEIERAVALRETWSHKNAGTPETYEHAARKQQGALARLFQSGAIDRGQLASAEQISRIYDSIASAVAIGTASLETRVDGGKAPGDRHVELFAQVRGELAYTRWRTMSSAIGPVSALLEMIVEDVGLTEVARRYRMHNRRVRQLLVDALNLWPRCLGLARDRLGDAWRGGC